jgi:hypothetical membrane protein
MMIRWIRANNVLIITIIFIAHFFAPVGYTPILHTMSELAGQGVPNRWVLTTGFFLGGLGYILFATLAYRKKQIPFWLYMLTASNGLMTFLLGVFPTSYDGLLTVTVDETIVIIHRYIAYMSNFLTILTIVIHAAISRNRLLRINHLAFLILAFVFSSFFILYDQDVRGIFQRLILLTTTLWTVTSYGVWQPVLLAKKHQQAPAVNR